MPQLEVDNLFQHAVLWVKNGYNADGDPTYATPIEICCRWLDNAQTKSSNPNSETIAFDALAIVDRVITVDSLMWLGTLADWYELETGTGTADRTESYVHSVKSFRAVPDIKGRSIRRKVGLMRHKRVP